MFDSVYAGLVGVTLTAIASVVVGIIARGSNKGATTVEFARAVVARLEKVENDLMKVQDQLGKSQRVTNLLIHLVQQLVLWGRAGGKGRMPPLSEDLHDYLDPTWWDDEDR